MEEFNTLEEYAGTVKKALKVSVADNNVSKDDRIEVIYATPPVAYAKMIEKVKNGSKPGPLITFSMSNINIDNNVQLNGFTTLTILDEPKSYRLRAPLIANLSYTVTICCLTEAEGDMLQAQILLAMPFNRPYYTKLNGQWVTMIASDPENLTTIDVDENKDKITRKQLKITIDRAYISHAYESVDNFNGKIMTGLYAIEEIK